MKSNHAAEETRMTKKKQTKAEKSMAPQMAAQTKKMRRLKVDDVSKGDDVQLREYHAKLTKETGGDARAHSKLAAERAKVVTLPCADCGEELTPMTRSILADGRPIHIGCPKAKKTKGPEPERAISGLPKHKGVKVPKPPPPPPSGVAAYCDFQGRTCLQVARDIATVTFIPFDLAGLHLTYLPTLKFDERYKPLKHSNSEVIYPVDKAVKTYVEFAREYGATQDVLDALGRGVKLKQEDVDMAKTKLATKVGNGAAKKSTGAGPKRETASGMFQTLIMEGKLSDDQIFGKVKAKFGLDEKKRSYVAWYRNHLKKAGKKPPAAKA
jgi:hypothetical protein